MTFKRTSCLLTFGLLAVSAFAQKAPVSSAPPDSQRVREEFVQLLANYPPTVRAVLSLDSALLVNKEYLEPYPALATYLSSHPEVARDPAFYVGTLGRDFHFGRDSNERDQWERFTDALAAFAGVGMAIGLLTWLIRTLIDYRRWHRLATVQTNVHTKLLDRFTANEDLLQYIQSPAGSKFLESSPIMLDAGPRSMGAPLARILWSVQAGLVLFAGGIGMQYASSGIDAKAAQALSLFGVLALALGLGFVASAGFSFLISQRMGLLGKRADNGGVQG